MYNILTTMCRCGFALTVLGIYFIYQFFFNSKAVFDGDRFIYNSGGADKGWFPPINIACKDLVDFKWSNIISFTKTNGKKLTFGSMRFSRKQPIRILKEIQARGGLQEIDIDKKVNLRTKTIQTAKQNDN